MRELAHTHGGELEVAVIQSDIGRWRVMVAFRVLTTVPAGHVVAGDYGPGRVDELIAALTAAQTVARQRNAGLELEGLDWRLHDRVGEGL
jgi:hypothetical protein